MAHLHPSDLEGITVVGVTSRKFRSGFSAPKPGPWEASRQTLVFETPWRQRRRHEISGLNRRNRAAATSLRFKSADGRKMERVITKPDPDSADVDLSQLEHISPI